MKIRTSAALGAASLLALATACTSGGDSDSSFQVRNSQFAVAGGTVIAISGLNIAFLADEATSGMAGGGGTPLNVHDADTIDSVAVFIDGAAKTETNLQVAATALAWAGSELYLVVDEALDNFDWNNSGGAPSGLVLLHWSKTTAVLAYVDDLATAGTTKMVAVGTTLFYSSATVPVGPLASNLRSILSSAPTTPVAVATTDAVGPLSPRIVRADEGLVFLLLDETVEGRTLNDAVGATDTDTTDTAVLALLDGTFVGDPIHPVGLATPGDSAPVRAKKVSSHDWQVGFLVHEAAQGATNLNSPALFAGSWYPSSQCTAGTHGDNDTNDDVLHYLRFASWTTNPGSNPIRNTGLVGVDRIAIANSFIATITPENAAAGTLGEGTCDLNQDGDRTDRVVRWCRIETGTNPIQPLNAPLNIHALFDCPGGAHGLAELQSHFVVVVSEMDDNRDLSGDTLKTFNVVGELSPSTTPTAWDFAHGSAQIAVGASFLAEQTDRARLDVAYEEKVFGQSLNDGTPTQPGDNDMLDSVPTFPEFSGSTLLFPGAGVALDLGNAGVTSAKEHGFYRIDENADSRDWNNDGDENDRILFRSDFTAGRTFAFAGLNTIAGTPAVFLNRDETAPRAGAFLTEELGDGPTGTDHNHDGDKQDLVLRWFTF